jgi:hypothetical protein
VESEAEFSSTQMGVLFCCCGLFLNVFFYPTLHLRYQDLMQLQGNGQGTPDIVFKFVIPPGTPAQGWLETKKWVELKCCV